MKNIKNYRLPLYALYKEFNGLKNNQQPGWLAKNNPSTLKFCNMIVSNSACTYRNRFFHKLSKYKKIDSGGRYLNNIGSPIEDKISFISQYKFTLAFENSSSNGYVTEKILQPFSVGSIPIYWGGVNINNDFNEEAFINRHSYRNDEEFIEKIIEIDQNPDLFHKMRNASIFKNNKPFINTHEDNILERFKVIFQSNIKPVAKKPSKQIISIFSPNIYLLQKNTKNIKSILREIQHRIFQS